MTRFLLFPPHPTVRLSGWQMLYQLWWWGMMASWPCVCPNQVGGGRGGGGWWWSGWITKGVFSQGECLTEPGLTDGSGPISKNPRTFALFLSFSFFSQSDSLWELEKCDVNVPRTALLGLWHFIKNDTNYCHLKLILQLSKFSPHGVPLFIFLTTQWNG